METTKQYLSVETKLSILYRDLLNENDWDAFLDRQKISTSVNIKRIVAEIIKLEDDKARIRQAGQETWDSL